VGLERLRIGGGAQVWRLVVHAFHLTGWERCVGRPTATWQEGIRPPSQDYGHGPPRRSPYYRDQCCTQVVQCDALPSKARPVACPVAQRRGTLVDDVVGLGGVREGWALVPFVALWSIEISVRRVGHWAEV
jgi:hypothetical protein